MGLSDVYFDTGAKVKSVQFAELAVEAAPGSRASNLKLGDAYYNVLRYRDALRHYEKALELGERPTPRAASTRSKPASALLARTRALLRATARSLGLVGLVEELAGRRVEVLGDHQRRVSARQHDVVVLAVDALDRPRVAAECVRVAVDLPQAHTVPAAGPRAARRGSGSPGAPATPTG
jgi:tetratricopeptide (TPR) repeat protein